MSHHPPAAHPAKVELATLKGLLGSEDFKPALAQSLAVLEQGLESAKACAMRDAAWRDPAAVGGHVIGITGPPGVGKSTLIGPLIRAWRAERKCVGVMAVDPSSRRSGGALLGDRTRFDTDPRDACVFVRSMAARGRLGGLAELTFPAVVLMRALFDVVVLESVGVGQSETEIRGACDTVALCVQPGSGDALQFMKAGVREVADLVIVTKRDLGALAARAFDAARAAFPAGEPKRWQPPVIAVSALRDESVTEAVAAMARHRQWLIEGGRFEAERRAQGDAWLTETARERFGQRGIEMLAARGEPAPSPFARWRAAMQSAGN